MDPIQNYLNFEPISFFKDQLLQQNDTDHILKQYFSSSLSFGTAGLRGIMQPGTSGINGFTIAKAAKALGTYLKKNNPQKQLSCCISYDNRHHSMQFADISARVLAHMGISVKLSRHLRPTPWLSFAIRELKCDAGIMITASHNPKQYNGFKAYLHDGGQVVSPHDKDIMTIMDSIHEFSLSPSSSPLIELIDEFIDRKYLDMLKHKFKDHGIQSTAIIYSPLCGTGATLVPLALHEMGFNNIHCVQEEMVIDPEFAGIKNPNPESEKATLRSQELLIKTNADIALITDPDADRLGLIINHKGKPFRPTGNQIAALILDYLIQAYPYEKDSIVVSSFVTTALLKVMCENNHLIHKEVLTGFKYIGQIIDDLEKDDCSNLFLFGAEESYGYLIGTHAKDKDAVIASVVLAKACAYAKKHNQTLYDRLIHLFETYGLYLESTHTVDFPQGTSSQDIKSKLDPLIKNPPHEFMKEPILEIKDFQSQKSLNLLNRETSLIPLPKADALGFYTAHSWLILRPSGTEPKLKIYAGSRVDDKKNIELAKQSLEVQLKEALDDFSQKYLG